MERVDQQRRRLHSFLRSGAFRGARRCLAQVEILPLNILDDSQEDGVMLVTWGYYTTDYFNYISDDG